MRNESSEWPIILGVLCYLATIALCILSFLSRFSHLERLNLVCAAVCTFMWAVMGLRWGERR